MYIGNTGLGKTGDGTRGWKPGYKRDINVIINKVMRNRNLVNRKLDQLETTLITLQQIVNRQSPIESYKVNIVKAQGIVNDLRDMVEREPMSPTELNKV